MQTNIFKVFFFFTKPAFFLFHLAPSVLLFFLCWIMIFFFTVLLHYVFNEARIARKRWGKNKVINVGAHRDSFLKFILNSSGLMCQFWNRCQEGEKKKCKKVGHLLYRVEKLYGVILWGFQKCYRTRFPVELLTVAVCIDWRFSISQAFCDKNVPRVKQNTVQAREARTLQKE